MKETARLTDRRIELDESEKEAIDLRLTLVQERLPAPTEVTITYFVPDKKKARRRICKRLRHGKND